MRTIFVLRDGELVEKTQDCIPSGITIIKDIEPYQAVGSDVALGGAAPAIKSRREHREYLKRNGYAEVGNHRFKPKQYEAPPPVAHDLRRALEEVKSRR